MAILIQKVNALKNVSFVYGASLSVYGNQEVHVICEYLKGVEFTRVLQVLDDFHRTIFRCVDAGNVLG